ncbi:hypothetical protein [Roseateles sp. BYS96W]|uniref:Uncharacterized protein n=1 Tax=Pelomonas nitida TaxID=3299027 RepID=A0ABW7G7F0_9BURK
MASVLNARLNQVVAVEGEPRSSFFNGRLLSAEDLTREQAARDDAERRLARLIGCGVAQGLTVMGSAGSSVVHVAAGLGVTAAGAVIDIGNLDLDLSSASQGASFNGFGNCAAGLSEAQPSAGLHLLTLTPAWSGQGRAATLLGEVGACNRRTQQPAVRARLIEVVATSGLSRNELAVALLSPGFGLATVPGAARVGWWMRQRIDGCAAAPGLTAEELPLALLQLGGGAVPAWIDTDSARRRLAPPPGSAGNAMWPQGWPVEMQALAAQFLAQLSEPATTADDVTWLPPALPLTAAQLERVRAVLPEVPLYADLLDRACFARALVEGWEGEPVLRGGASLYLAQLNGHADRLLLRAVATSVGTLSDAQRSVAREGAEQTSARVASAAGRVLAAGRRHPAGGPSADALAAAASALTQAPNRRKR